MSAIKEKAEKTIAALEQRVAKAQTYIERMEDLIFEAPTERPRPGTAAYIDLSNNFEKIMKIYLSLLDTSRKLMLISQEERDRESMENDELYYFIKNLPPEDVALLRDYMGMKIKERVNLRASS